MGLSRTVGQTVIYHGRSDIGMVREENQDSFCIQIPEAPEDARNKGILMVVADGMGGLAYGATASRFAVESMQEVYYGSEGDPAELHVLAAVEGNRRIHNETMSLPGNQPMGSTMTSLVLLEGCALLAHVGDSRAYRFSTERGLEQLTRDHTLVQELAERGEIEPDSLPYLLHRNVLTRGLGLQEDVEIDRIEISETMPGETFLLCSDGLYDVVADSEIESRLIAHGSMQVDLVDDLIELARSRGAPDNVTVLVARIETNEETKATPSVSPAGVGDFEGDERRALGILPRSLFVPISYFIVFALGVLLSLHFENSSSREDALEGWAKQILSDPRIADRDVLKRELEKLLGSDDASESE